MLFFFFFFSFSDPFSFTVGSIASPAYQLNRLSVQ